MLSIWVKWLQTSSQQPMATVHRHTGVVFGVALSRDGASWPAAARMER